MSIRLRLTIYWAVIIAALLIIAGLAVFLLFERQQWGALDGALMEEADTAAATISRLGPGAAIDSIVRRLSEERDLGPRRRVRVVSGDRIVADFGDSTADLPEIQPHGRHFVPVEDDIRLRQIVFEVAVGKNKFTAFKRRSDQSLGQIVDLTRLGC